MSRLIEQQMMAQRKSWVDLGDGKRVQITRPPETMIGEFSNYGDGKFSVSSVIDRVIKYTVGWDGITEADLLGASVGASDLVPFDPALWALVIEDRAEWLMKIAQALTASIANHYEQKAQAEKN
jgi:hypothetical protein